MTKRKVLLRNTSFLYKQIFFSTKPQCCLTFSWIELQMWLNTCNHHHILYLVYLCPCHGLCPFLSDLCDLFFIFSLIFIVINHISSFKCTYLFFLYFLEYACYFLMITWMNKAHNFKIAKLQPQSVAYLLLDFLPISAWHWL